VQEALASIREVHPRLPILACYPHVEVARAEAVRSLGGVAIARGAFASQIADALLGRLS
jgi:hypothetical protein